MSTLFSIRQYVVTKLVIVCCFHQLAACYNFLVICTQWYIHWYFTALNHSIAHYFCVETIALKCANTAVILSADRTGKFAHDTYLLCCRSNEYNYLNVVASYTGQCNSISYSVMYMLLITWPYLYRVVHSDVLSIGELWCVFMCLQSHD